MPDHVIRGEDRTFTQYTEGVPPERFIVVFAEHRDHRNHPLMLALMPAGSVAITTVRDARRFVVYRDRSIKIQWFYNATADEEARDYFLELVASGITSRIGTVLESRTEDGGENWLVEEGNQRITELVSGPEPAAETTPPLTDGPVPPIRGAGGGILEQFFATMFMGHDDGVDDDHRVHNIEAAHEQAIDEFRARLGYSAIEVGSPPCIPFYPGYEFRFAAENPLNVGDRVTLDTSGRVIPDHHDRPVGVVTRVDNDGLTTIRVVGQREDPRIRQFADEVRIANDRAYQMGERLAATYEELAAATERIQEMSARLQELERQVMQAPAVGIASTRIQSDVAITCGAECSGCRCQDPNGRPPCSHCTDHTVDADQEIRAPGNEEDPGDSSMSLDNLLTEQATQARMASDIAAELRDDEPGDFGCNCDACRFGARF